MPSRLELRVSSLIQNSVSWIYSRPIQRRYAKLLEPNIQYLLSDLCTTNMKVRLSKTLPHTHIHMSLLSAPLPLSRVITRSRRQYDGESSSAWSIPNHCYWPPQSTPISQHRGFRRVRAITHSPPLSEFVHAIFLKILLILSIISFNLFTI